MASTSVHAHKPYHRIGNLARLNRGISVQQNVAFSGSQLGTAGAGREAGGLLYVPLAHLQILQKMLLAMHVHLKNLRALSKTLGI